MKSAEKTQRERECVGVATAVAGDSKREVRSGQSERSIGVLRAGRASRPIRAVAARPSRGTRLAANQSRRRASFACGRVSPVGRAGPAANQSRRRASFAWDASRRLDAARVPSSMSALGAVHSRVDGDESLLLLLLLLWSIGVVGNHLRRVRRRHGLGSSLSGDSAQNQGDSARRGPSRPCGT